MTDSTARFTGTAALVTGASRGIGLGIAERLVAEGARVCITGRDEANLAAAVEHLGREHAIGVAGKADDPDHQRAAVEATTAAFGRLDVLVNNAGINPAFGPLRELADSAARKIMDVNVLAALQWTRAALAAGLGTAEPQRQGAVVNIASVAGLGPAPGIAYYGVSKAALLGLTVQLASELSPQVRVNAIAPAVVKTKFAEMLYAADEAAAAAAYPLQRLGEPGDVAAAAAFLASPDASWITGQTLVLDGGMSLRTSL